jgi:hypothetical protein
VLFYPNNTNAIFDFTANGWVNASAGGTPAGSEVIYPGEGFVVNVLNGKTVPVMGCVKPGPTQVSLYAGAINLVGTCNPVLSGGQTLGAFNFPGSLAQGADYVEPFNDNGQLQSAGVYTVSGTNMFGASGNANTLSVNASNAVVVGVVNSKSWVMPSFYTSGN